MSTKIYKCFVASPSDTSTERAICDKVFTEINKSIGQHLNFRIESWKWENDSRPSFGQSGQDVINQQVGADYDIFIGIMYKKFGTPTLKAGSGTEEEFDNAYKLYAKDSHVEIMFYFNVEASSLRGIDYTQLGKVQEFKSKIATLGGLYWEYDGANAFEEELRKHLHGYFLKKKPIADIGVTITPKNSVIHDEELMINSSVSLMLNNRLNNSLCNFSSQPIIWIEPILSRNSRISQNADENYEHRISINSIITDCKNTIIKSPPQFGLTCLAHYLAKQAWELNKFWLYIDSSETKAHNIGKYISREILSLGVKNTVPECIILDSWNDNEPDSFKKLKAVIDEFPNTALVVMQTIEGNAFQNEADDNTIESKFEVLHLLALPRTQIRKIVSAYNTAKGIGEEDIILTKVIADLDVLNIHRTPLNCLTLLKVAEKYFDESPVNRTQMLEMVLFILFIAVS